MNNIPLFSGLEKHLLFKKGSGIKSPNFSFEASLWILCLLKYTQKKQKQ
jgi:hypothetical protein